MLNFLAIHPLILFVALLIVLLVSGVSSDLIVFSLGKKVAFTAAAVFITIAWWWPTAGKKDARTDVLGAIILCLVGLEILVMWCWN